METTTLSSIALRKMAHQAIRDEARAAGIRARCIGWSLIIGGPYGPVLLALGQRTDDIFRQGDKAYKFDVRTAI